jgi:hypothetical protein
MPLDLEPGAPLAIALRITTRSATTGGSLRIGCADSGIVVHQPASALLAVAVLPADGSSFPFWTEPGNFSATSLEGSWSNFPNPFAAGREETRFVFYLPAQARVSIHLWTPRGDRVATPVDGASFAAGIHQDARWDGRNFRGQPVYNGVYVAELEVRYDNGTSERLLRKVMVVR